VDQVDVNLDQETLIPLEDLETGEMENLIRDLQDHHPLLVLVHEETLVLVVDLSENYSEMTLRKTWKIEIQVKVDPQDFWRT
jgi:hypothetical protein